MSSPLKSAFFEILQTDTLKFGFYTAIAMASALFSTLALKEAGYSSHISLIINGLDNIFCAFLLVFICTFYRKKRTLFTIWNIMTWGAAAGWGFLAFTGFALASQLSLMILFATMVMTHTASICLFANTLNQVQEGEKSALKLAIFMLATPFLKLLMVALSGFVADIHFAWFAAFLGGLLLAGNIFWHKQKWLHSPALISTKRIWNMSKSPDRLKLIFLSAIFNMLNVPVRFVFTPLYFYEKTGGSPSKVGGFLSLLALVALIAHAAKNYAKKTSVDSYNLMLFGVFALNLVPLIWILFYDNVWVVASALMVSEILIVIWSYGFYIELRKASGNTPAISIWQWQIINGFTCAFSCIVLGLLTINYMENLPFWLGIQFAVFMAYWIYFFLSFNRGEKSTSQN